MQSLFCTVTLEPNRPSTSSTCNRPSIKGVMHPSLTFSTRNWKKLPQIVVFSLRESVLSNNVGLLNPAVPIPFEALLVGKKRMRPKYHRSPSDSTVNVFFSGPFPCGTGATHANSSLLACRGPSSLPPMFGTTPERNFSTLMMKVLEKQAVCKSKRNTLS